MTTTKLGHAVDVRGWPSLSRAARILGVSASTLSRRRDLETESVGLQELRISPTAIIILAREYRRRVLDEVAFDLAEYARACDPSLVDAIQAEIDQAWAKSAPAVDGSPTEFLQTARALLPEKLFRQVEHALLSDVFSRGVVGEVLPSDPDLDQPVSKKRSVTPVSRSRVRRRVRRKAGVRA